MDGKIALGDIQKSFASPIDQDVYNLVGVAEYIGPKVSRRSSTSVGHYRAIARRNNTWVIYDDTKKKLNKGISVKNTHNLSVEMLIYGKV